jgi:hypothetical protein
VLVQTDRGVFEDLGQHVDIEDLGMRRSAAEIGMFGIHPRDDLKQFQDLIDAFLKLLDALFEGRLTEFRHGKVLWIAVSNGCIGRGARRGCMELIKPFMKTSEHLHERSGMPLQAIHVL